MATAAQNAASNHDTYQDSHEEEDAGCKWRSDVALRSVYVPVPDGLEEMSRLALLFTYRFEGAN